MTNAKKIDIVRRRERDIVGSSFLEICFFKRLYKKMRLFSKLVFWIFARRGEGRIFFGFWLGKVWRGNMANSRRVGGYRKSGEGGPRIRYVTSTNLSQRFHQSPKGRQTPTQNSILKNLQKPDPKKILPIEFLGEGIHWTKLMCCCKSSLPKCRPKVGARQFYRNPASTSPWRTLGSGS